MAHKPILSGAVLALTAFTSFWLHAAEWAAEPRVSLRETYNDNIRLTSAPHEDTWSTTLEPSIKLMRRTELWDLNASGRVRSAWHNEDSLDATDNFLSLAAKRSFERGFWDVSASLANDTTLQSEILDLDTGLVNRQIDRSQRALRMSAQYMISEATWVEVSAGYTALRYDDGERFGLLDYDYLTPSLQLVHQLNPKTQVFGVLSHARVDYDAANELESKTDSVQIGANYNITERWSINGSIGGRRTKTSSVTPVLVAPAPGLEAFCGFLVDCQIDYVPTDTDSTGLVYNASLSREFETGDIGLRGSQSVTPSSTGTDTESTSVTLYGTRRFSHKLSGKVELSYISSSTVSDVTTRANRTRYRIAPSLSWRLTEDLAMNAGYAYTRVDRDTATNDAVDSNSAFVSLGYTWPRTAVSR